MELLNDTLVWFSLSFIAFLVLTWKFGKTVIIELLDGRIEDIRKNIETAENLRVEAQELLAQYQRKHKDAVKDAESIIEIAKKQAAEIQKQAEEDLAESITRREKQLQERLQRMEQTAVEEVRQYAANLSIRATAELIAQHLDKKTNEMLVDDSIKEIGRRIH